MLEIFETSEDAALQSFLAGPLIVRTGLSATRRTVDELAAAVREELGVSGAVRPVDTAERYSQWRDASQALLAQRPPAAAESTKLLQHVVDVTRMATLGAALARGELGSAEFETLWNSEPVKLAGNRRTTSTSPRAPRLSSTELRNLDRTIDYLRGYTRLDPNLRLSYLRAISGYAGRVTDVSPQQGQHIAMYLAGAKSVDEHERVMPAVDGILRWRMVRLGLADQMISSRLRTEHLGELAGKALHRDVDIDEDGWRADMRDELLTSVARELAAEASLAGAGTGNADRAAKAMTDYYRTQAKLDGVGPEAYQAAGSPADVLQLLIQQSASRTSAAGTDSATRQRVERLPHELAAIEYIADSDVAKTVSLQRILLDLSERETSRASRGKSADLQDIKNTLGRQSEEATHILEQLALGERALLRYWLVRNRP